MNGNIIQKDILDRLILKMIIELIILHILKIGWQKFKQIYDKDRVYRKCKNYAFFMGL